MFICSSVFAQVQTTPNVITTTVQQGVPGVQQSWTGFTTTTSEGGGLSGGNVPGYNPSTGQFMFGYAQGTFAYTMAINSALSGTGIQLSGIEYGLTYFNQDYSRGTLNVSASVLSNTGSTLESYSHNLPQTVNGWTQWSQTQTFVNQYSLSNLGNATLTFTGKDDRFWAGYYGPQFKDPFLRFNYIADICASNPLSSPDCPGYAAALLTQQCSISALYNPACPGYAAAYFTQQCSLNPLYSPSCPGYASAYLTQQCNLDGLYSTSCPNYAEAYAKKNILSIDTTGTNTTNTNMPSKTEATTTVSNDGKVKTEVSKTGDSNVDSVIETKATSASPSDATSTVKLAPSPSTGGQSVSAQTNTKTETKTETKTASSSNQQSQTTTARTERNEQKSGSNEGKSSSEMKQAAQQKAQEEMKKAEGAKSFEAQVATQVAVVNAIAFVPGFDAYQNTKIIDVNALQLQRQYGKDVVDNRRLGRGLFGPTDRLHQEMVNQQYR